MPIYVFAARQRGAIGVATVRVSIRAESAEDAWRQWEERHARDLEVLSIYTNARETRAKEPKR